MTDDFSVTAKNRIRQLSDKGHYDRETVYAILDAGLVAHVAFTTDTGPVVVPMIYARDGDAIYLHGARKARVIRMLESTDTCCVNVTLVDGIVLARSAFNSSMNYRSVTLFGPPSLLADHEEKVEAMRLISEHLMPGRWDELRAPHDREVRMTGVIRMPIESAAAKISAGPPEDEDDDYGIPIWAGVVPVTTTTGRRVTDDRVPAGVEASGVVSALQDRTY